MLDSKKDEINYVLGDSLKKMSNTKNYKTVNSVFIKARFWLELEYSPLHTITYGEYRHYVDELIAMKKLNVKRILLMKGVDKDAKNK